jgi:hypothetical protein
VAQALSWAYAAADAAIVGLVVWLLVRVFRRPPPDAEYGDREGW